MELHVRKESVVAGKIFELGLARFGSNPDYIADYAGFLVAMNDDQNVRALFERAVNSLLASDKDAAYPIWCMYVEYEQRYGELESLRSLERRFKEAYPLAGGSLEVMCKRWSYDALTVPMTDCSLVQALDPPTLASRCQRIEAIPFVLSDVLIDLLGRLPMPGKFDGPVLDPGLVLRAIANCRVSAGQAPPLPMPQRSRSRSPGRDHRDRDRPPRTEHHHHHRTDDRDRSRRRR
jgi:hypothetical protein